MLRKITNIIFKSDLKTILYPEILDKYFKDKDYIDTTILFLNKRSYDNDIEVLYTIYNYTECDPITWMDQTGLDKRVKKLFGLEPRIIAQFCSSLIEKHPDWFNFDLHGAEIVIYCPFLIHKYKDKFNWSKISSTIVIYTPWLIERYSNRLDWLRVFYGLSTCSKKIFLSYYKPMLKKYINRIDKEGLKKFIQNEAFPYQSEDRIEEIVSMIFHDKCKTELITNIIERSKIGKIDCDSIREKYFSTKSCIDITQLNMDEVNLIDVLLLYNVSSYNPFLWLDQNGLFKIEYFEKFATFFIEEPRCRSLVYKYLGNIARRKRISYYDACRNATKLLK